MFVRSIQFRTLEIMGDQSSFPDMSTDPFTPAQAQTDRLAAASTTKGEPSTIPPTSLNAKPTAPPTPALVEMPTCPVCLERMDESTGLLTILCQHVFHCSCLQKWRGSGCPVCRYTQNGLGKSPGAAEGSTALNECSICRSDANLWICLICGTVGCGRYDAAHAFLHYQQSLHRFAMDLTTQRVWDYAGDGYVHRIVQSTTDGKLMALPSATALDDATTAAGPDGGLDEFVPRAKLDSIGREYSSLLTSQLESQRCYFEETVARAADKASQASQAAVMATATAAGAERELLALRRAHDRLVEEVIPGLERERDRAVRKAERLDEVARRLERDWRDEQALGGSLLAKVRFLGGEVEGLRRVKGELEEQNRDLGFFISGGERLRLRAVGMEGGEGEDGVGGTVVLDEGMGMGKGKGKEKGKGGGGNGSGSGGMDGDRDGGGDGGKAGGGENVAAKVDAKVDGAGNGSESKGKRKGKGKGKGKGKVKGGGTGTGTGLDKGIESTEGDEGRG